MKRYPSLEIVPPLKGMTKDELLNDIRPFIEFNPKYINVTCHRDEVTYEEQATGSGSYAGASARPPSAEPFSPNSRSTWFPTSSAEDLPPNRSSSSYKTSSLWEYPISWP